MDRATIFSPTDNSGRMPAVLKDHPALVTQVGQSSIDDKAVTPVSTSDSDGLPVAFFDHPIFSQLCKPNLSEMPEEILLPILKDVGTLHSLWSVIIASKRLYNIFQTYAVEIVDAILERGSTPKDIANRMRAVFFVRFILPHADTDLDLPFSGSTDDPDDIVDVPIFSRLPGPIRASDLCKLVCLTYRIHGLAHYCLETSLEKCEALLTRSAPEFDLLKIPNAVARSLQQYTPWPSPRFMWSTRVEEHTILSIWRLQYFYQIKEGLLKINKKDYSNQGFLRWHNGLRTISIAAFFHSHVREQVLTVLAIFEGLNRVPRAKPHTQHVVAGPQLSRRQIERQEEAAYRCGPIGGLRRTQAQEWLDGIRTSDEEPPKEEDEEQIEHDFWWCRTHGPWQLPLPELGLVDNTALGRCAFVATPATLTAESRETEAESSSSSSGLGALPNKPPAWTFLKTIKRPDMSDFTNLTELTLPIRPYRELGVFLFDEGMLMKMGLWPDGGIHRYHLQRIFGQVGEIDQYAWQWIKLLSRLKQYELISEEEMAGWRAMGHYGRRPVFGRFNIPMWVRREFEYISYETEILLQDKYSRFERLSPYQHNMNTARYFT
ncbi:hypothetical protein V8F20_008300 [Naviculisporaceae sp. PSN 640]